MSQSFSLLPLVASKPILLLPLSPSPCASPTLISLTTTPALSLLTPLTLSPTGSLIPSLSLPIIDQLQQLVQVSATVLLATSASGTIYQIDIQGKEKTVILAVCQVASLFSASARQPYLLPLHKAILLCDQGDTHGRTMVVGTEARQPGAKSTTVQRETQLFSFLHTVDSPEASAARVTLAAVSLGPDRTTGIGAVVSLCLSLAESIAACQTSRHASIDPSLPAATLAGAATVGSPATLLGDEQVPPPSAPQHRRLNVSLSTWDEALQRLTRTRLPLDPHLLATAHTLLPLPLLPGPPSQHIAHRSWFCLATDSHLHLITGTGAVLTSTQWPDGWTCPIMLECSTVLPLADAPRDTTAFLVQESGGKLGRILVTVGEDGSAAAARGSDGPAVPPFLASRSVSAVVEAVGSFYLCNELHAVGTAIVANPSLGGDLTVLRVHPALLQPNPLSPVLAASIPHSRTAILPLSGSPSRSAVSRSVVLPTLSDILAEQPGSPLALALSGAGPVVATAAGARNGAFFTLTRRGVPTTPLAARQLPLRPTRGWQVSLALPGAPRLSLHARPSSTTPTYLPASHLLLSSETNTCVVPLLDEEEEAAVGDSRYGSLPALITDQPTLHAAALPTPPSSPLYQSCRRVVLQVCPRSVHVHPVATAVTASSTLTTLTHFIPLSTPPLLHSASTASFSLSVDASNNFQTFLWDLQTKTARLRGCGRVRVSPGGRVVDVAVAPAGGQGVRQTPPYAAVVDTTGFLRLYLIPPTMPTTPALGDMPALELVATLSLPGTPTDVLFVQPDGSANLLVFVSLTTGALVRCTVDSTEHTLSPYTLQVLTDTPLSLALAPGPFAGCGMFAASSSVCHFVPLHGGAVEQPVPLAMQPSPLVVPLLSLSLSLTEGTPTFALATAHAASTSSRSTQADPSLSLSLTSVESIVPLHPGSLSIVTGPDGVDASTGSSRPAARARRPPTLSAPTLVGSTGPSMPLGATARAIVEVPVPASFASSRSLTHPLLLAVLESEARRERLTEPVPSCLSCPPPLHPTPPPSPTPSSAQAFSSSLRIFDPTLVAIATLEREREQEELLDAAEEEEEEEAVGGGGASGAAVPSSLAALSDSLVAIRTGQAPSSTSPLAGVFHEFTLIPGNALATSMTAVSFAENGVGADTPSMDTLPSPQQQLHLVVGTAPSPFAAADAAAGASDSGGLPGAQLHTYMLGSSVGLTLQHSTTVEAGVRAVCEVNGLLAAAVGSSLCLFRLGTKRLLRVARAAPLGSPIATLVPMPSTSAALPIRLAATTVAGSLAVFAYVQAAGTLHVESVSLTPNAATSLAVPDTRSLVSGDRWGRLSLSLAPSSSKTGVMAKKVTVLPRSRGTKAHVPDSTAGQLELRAVAEVASPIVSLSCVPAVPTSGTSTSLPSPAVLVTTVSGASAALVPLVSKSEENLLRNVEREVEREIARTTGDESDRDATWVATRRGNSRVVRGDVLLLFSRLDEAQRASVAEAVDSTVDEVDRALATLTARLA